MESDYMIEMITYIFSLNTNTNKKIDRTNADSPLHRCLWKNESDLHYVQICSVTNFIVAETTVSMVLLINLVWFINFAFNSFLSGSGQVRKGIYDVGLALIFIYITQQANRHTRTRTIRYWDVFFPGK